MGCQLLSLLESWAPASSLINYILACKSATHLALATAKNCSDLTLLKNDNQYLFLQLMLLFLLLHLVEDRIVGSSSTSNS